MRRDKGPIWSACLFLLGVLSAHPSEAAPDRPVIAVGEVSAKVAGADLRTEQFLRDLVTREIERLRLGTVPGESYVFSVSLVRLDGRVTLDGSRVTSVVSATLRSRKSGALSAILRGRATAEGARHALEETKDEALAAAVHGAVRRIPEAL